MKDKKQVRKMIKQPISKAHDSEKLQVESVTVTVGFMATGGQLRSEVSKS